MSAKRSTRSTRRRRRARKHGTATLVLATVAAAVASYRSSLVLAAVLAAVAGILITATIILRHHPAVRQVMEPPRPAPATVRARAKALPASPADKARSGGRRHAVPGPAKARDFGDWLPPKSPRLLSVTPECAGDEHAICADPEACECTCNHEPAVIVAANQARHDQAAHTANGSAEPGF